MTLSPDGTSLYAVNAGANSIAVIPLTGGRANRVIGLIPTAYEPHDITFSADGTWMYIVNGTECDRSQSWSFVWEYGSAHQHHLSGR